MRTVTLPQEILDLIPRVNSDSSIPMDSVTPFIKATLNHLQTTRQNLSTGDFVELVHSHLNITYDFISGFTISMKHALHCVTTPPELDSSFRDSSVYHLVDSWIRINLSNISRCDYYRNLDIVYADFPTKSTTNPKKIAVWRNTSKMGNLDRRQTISVRKWIKSTLVGLSEKQIEDLAKKIDAELVPFSELKLDVRHHSSYEFDAWKRAYTGDKIRSCMHPDSDSEVGTKRTFTCYCTGYHGLPDNGLSLTVLYQNDTPVARAITFNDDGLKCYVRAYGDDRLEKWLINNGYDQADFAYGTILYTNEDLLKPYVDGDRCSADHFITDDGKHYWELYYDGEYDLQNTDAYAIKLIECECCGSYHHEEYCNEAYSVVDGCNYNVCDGCLDDNSYEVYTGGDTPETVFFHDGHSPDTNSGYVKCNGAYYETDSLGDYNLRLVDGEVYDADDLYRCEITEEYFTYDEVYTSVADFSTTKPVYFPYECVSKEYWDENVVECACGVLALEGDAAAVDGDVV